MKTPSPNYTNPNVHAVKNYIKSKLIVGVITTAIACLLAGNVIGNSIHNKYVEYNAYWDEEYYSSSFYDDYEKLMGTDENFTPADVATKMALRLFIGIEIIEITTVLIAAHFKTKFDIMENTYRAVQPSAAINYVECPNCRTRQKSTNAQCERCGQSFVPNNTQIHNNANPIAPHRVDDMSIECPKCGKIQVDTNTHCKSCGQPFKTENYGQPISSNHPPVEPIVRENGFITCPNCNKTQSHFNTTCSRCGHPFKTE